MEQKWEAKVCTSLEKAEPDQIWPFFQDFFGLHKWFSGLPNCHGIHGTNGEPGCIRYCSGFGLRQEADEIKWSKERLVAIDEAQKTFTYEMVDSNIGFKSYVSTIKVVAGGGGGGMVEWWISLEPVEGAKLEDLVAKYQVALQLIVKKMEEDAVSGSS
ncbi:lachrymatory-factor synthase-like [Salvia hispanica]|uniref:lachrymatory-factor synthase-like n=1 Tax=Salvia hispanica TaxID=49212 RepID=UPI0020094136|nr:lachrymatory-factor synthase-like [Salvia hispanica]